MPTTPLTFRRSTARGWGFVQFGLFLILPAVVFPAMAYRFREAATPFTFLPLGVFGGIAVLFVVGGLRVVADRAPKLTADGDGLFDHTSPGGGRRIPWGEVQNLDCHVDPFSRTGQLGKLILYRRAGGGEVTTEFIDLTGLEGGPLHVFTEVKRVWLQATAPPGPGGPGN